LDDLDLNNLGMEENLLKDDDESVSSMEKLMNMNIIEVDDVNNSPAPSSDLMQEFAQGFLAHERNLPDYLAAQSGGVDPLLGNMSGHRSHHLDYQNDQEQLRLNQMQRQQEILLKQQYEMQSLEQEQMRQMQAMMQNNSIAGDDDETLTVEKVSKLASMGSADLEREKMKLLARLQEINARSSGSGPSMGAINNIHMTQQQMQSNRFFAHSGGMSSGVSSVMGSNRNDKEAAAGETPLSAFLRSKNKGNPSTSGVAATPITASLLSQKVPNAPAAASILDAAPMGFGGSTNPFLQKTNSGNSLLGAMSKSSSSQRMIQNSLSGRNLRSSGVALSGRSGQNLMEMLSSDLTGKNAAWDNSGTAAHHRIGKGSFTSSGILPSHASEGHLLSRATVSASLAKTKNRMGSLSRENSLYNLMKNKHGSHKTLNALGRQNSSSRLSKTGSRGSLARSDSKDSLIKRSGSRKHRVGASTSVPHLGMNPRHSSSSGFGGGGNALW
jgi:hypothetical protein